MTLTILDPSTGNRITVEVPIKAQPSRRIRRRILRELDRADVSKRHRRETA